MHKYIGMLAIKLWLSSKLKLWLSTIYPYLIMTKKEDLVTGHLSITVFKVKRKLKLLSEQKVPEMYLSSERNKEDYE